MHRAQEFTPVRPKKGSTSLEKKKKRDYRITCVICHSVKMVDKKRDALSAGKRKKVIPGIKTVTKTSVENNQGEGKNQSLTLANGGETQSTRECSQKGGH